MVISIIQKRNVINPNTQLLNTINVNVTVISSYLILKFINKVTLQIIQVAKGT